MHCKPAGSPATAATLPTVTDWAEHPEFPRLRDALRAAAPRAVPWAGTLYRSVAPAYAAGRHILSGRGAFEAGGRFNAPGLYPTVYASLDPQTAMAETLASCRYWGLPEEEALPRVFVAIRARLGQVLDLRDGGERQRIRLSLERMVQCDWRRAQGQGQEALTQALGRAAYDAGLEALLVPSAAAEGGNAVIFPERLGERSSLAAQRVRE
jgi:RES domain-containing protein